eukprot:TRINITY_DN38763_c0_g1_i1.p1 TRINITY_DN38763_c0_g1~~TRINITY_DN38763_c0_g1_i1.p1  ORF type:complete len:180 (-),score=39.80 TRINITY_DN38763_c0_g1_i1:31-570(-)
MTAASRFLCTCAAAWVALTWSPAEAISAVAHGPVTAAAVVPPAPATTASSAVGEAYRREVHHDAEAAQRSAAQAQRHLEKATQALKVSGEGLKVLKKTLDHVEGAAANVSHLYTPQGAPVAPGNATRTLVSEKTEPAFRGASAPSTESGGSAPSGEVRSGALMLSGFVPVAAAIAASLA